MSEYTPLDAQLYRSCATDVDPDLVQACRRGQPGDVVTEVHPGVFRFALMSPTWCERMAQELERREAWSLARGEALRRPNSMNEYGLVLSEVGFEDVMQELLESWVRPLAEGLFPEFGGGSIDEQHGFLVEYGRDRDRDLGFHVDDSEVTLNLCLGGDFAGSELYFRGVRCDAHRQTGCSRAEAFEYEHEPGVAILHAGRHRHGVWPVERGRRRNLILWCRSSTYRERMRAAIGCPDWCGFDRSSSPATR